MSARKLAPEVIERMREMRRQRVIMREIAAACGAAPRTVARYVKDIACPRPGLKPEMIERIRELYRQKTPFKIIQAELGVCTDTIVRHTRDLPRQRRPRRRRGCPYCKRKSLERRERIRKLYLAGASWTAIQEELGVSGQDLSDAVRDLPRRPRLKAS